MTGAQLLALALATAWFAGGLAAGITLGVRWAYKRGYRDGHADGRYDTKDPTPVSTLLCQLPGDKPLLGEHRDGCWEPKCRGCMPKPAEDPLRVCTACKFRVTDHVVELPQLAEELLIPTRIRGGGTADEEPQDSVPATLAANPALLSDEAMDLRSEITRLWVRWGDVLMSDLFPEVERPPGWTLREVVDHWSLFLLGHEQTAADFAAQVDDLWQRAHRTAYPSPPPGQLLGHCPTCDTPIRSDRLIGIVECRGCGVKRTVEEWTRVFVGDLSASTSAAGADLLAWLSARHQRTIAPEVLRQWASRGVRVIHNGERTLVKLERLGHDERGRTLYSVAQADKIARQLYGTTQIGSLTTMDDELRSAIHDAIKAADYETNVYGSSDYDALTDAVMAVLAERKIGA